MDSTINFRSPIPNQFFDKRGALGVEQQQHADAYA
jgi:hypothetical protein